MKTKVIIMMSLFISLFLTGCEKELVEVPGEVPGQLPPEGKPSDLPDGYFEVTFSAGYGGGDTRTPVTGTDSRVRHLRYVIYKSTGEFVKEKVVLNTTDAAPSWPMAALKDTLPKGQYTAVFLANVEKTQFPIPVSGGGTNYADVLTNYQTMPGSCYPVPSLPTLRNFIWPMYLSRIPLLNLMYCCSVLSVC